MLNVHCQTDPNRTEQNLTELSAVQLGNAATLYDKNKIGNTNEPVVTGLVTGNIDGLGC